MFYFGTKIGENSIETPEGYLTYRNVPIARTGEQIYLARELGLTEGDGERPVKVYREEEEVFSPEAMSSFEGKDVTNEHPQEQVNPSNFSNYSKGHIEKIRRDGDFLVADLVIKDPILISEVRNKVKREVSCGYMCEYVPYKDGYKQTNIRGNHVAVVPQGRAGHEVAIKDSAAEAQKGAHKMSATKALLEFFGIAAKDATPEELATLADNAATVLDAEPAKKAPDAEPAEAKAKDEDIPKGDDLGSKLDKILERIETIEKKVNGHGGPKEAHDETAIDDEITKLGGKDEDEVEAESEQEELAEDSCGIAKDAAVACLRTMRPVVAAIPDEVTKRAVTDAILASVRGKSEIPGIQRATQDAAKANAAMSGKTDYEKICEGQQTAYNARNPHTAKKEG